jgi:hypothetical protein
VRRYRDRAHLITTELLRHPPVAAVAGAASRPL